MLNCNFIYMYKYSWNIRDKYCVRCIGVQLQFSKFSQVQMSRTNVNRVCSSIFTSATNTFLLPQLNDGFTTKNISTYR